MGRVLSKECYFVFTCTFLTFFVVFYLNICVFIIFISFFDKISFFEQQNINQSETGIDDKKLSMELYGEERWHYVYRKIGM